MVMNPYEELEWQAEHQHRIARGLEYDVGQLKIKVATLEAENAELRQRAEQAEASAAAMREALQSVILCAAFIQGSGVIIDAAREALQDNAGADLLERLAKAEANAVKPVHWKSYCNGINCDGGPYKNRYGTCKDPQCNAVDVLEWLEANGNIKVEE